MQFLDLKKQHKLIKKELDEAIKRVFDNGSFIGGPEVKNLEEEIAKFCNTKYAIGVNSGTDAILLSLKALGIGRGDEVITSPFTFIATAEVIASCGAKPVFTDINPQTFNIEPSKIEKAITKRTKAIIPVHLFGQMAEMTDIMEISRKHKLFVVEDAAQAIGAKYKFQIQKTKINWRKAGSIGDTGCFSFFPTKNLGCYGDGGMVTTNNKKLADKIRLLRNHGSSPKNKYLNLILGGSSRLDAFQAAFLKTKLKYLEQWNSKRADNAAYYNSHLGCLKQITTPFVAKNNNHIFHQYTIRANGKTRNKLADYLKEQEIPAMIYYPLPLHLQPTFKYLGYKKGDFPEAEKAAKEVLSLPIYPELPQKDQNFICQKIGEFFNR